MGKLLTTEKIKLLKKYLRSEESDFDYEDDFEVTVSEYGEEFEVNPHTAYDGLSPDEAKKDIELLRKALRIVVGDGTDKWTTAAFRADRSSSNSHDYTSLAKRLSENKETSEMMHVGIHTLVNTLYSLMPDNKGPGTVPHVLSLREAFNGQEV